MSKKTKAKPEPVQELVTCGRCNTVVWTFPKEGLAPQELELLKLQAAQLHILLHVSQDMAFMREIANISALENAARRTDLLRAGQTKPDGV